MKKVIRLTESDLIRIVKRVISEQSILPNISRFNLSKFSKTPHKGRIPLDSPDTPGDDWSCYEKNIKNAFDYCKNNKSKFLPDAKSKEIAKKLYDNMNGISFGGAFKTIDSIVDYTQFCKVDNSFFYEGNDLKTWVGDEISLPADMLSNRITKLFVPKVFSCDECNTNCF
jgi:hypothetical protein